MPPTKLKNFRLDEHYVGMLAWFSERFDTSESEILRRALDDLNTRYGLALRLAERFIEELRNRYGDDARLEFRLRDNKVRSVAAPKHYAPEFAPTFADVLVDGAVDSGLIGTLGLGTIEERISGRERIRVYLEPTVSSPYQVSAFGLHVSLYIGEVDPRSPATLSIRLGDLTKEMQEFWGLIGRPQGPNGDDDAIIERRAFPAAQ